MNFAKNYLIRLVSRKEIMKPLGRWNLDYCNNKMDIKMDFIDRDYCDISEKHTNIIIPKEPKEIILIKKYDCSPFRVSNIDFIVHEKSN